MFSSRHWQLISYDIGDNRRLQKIHRTISRYAVPLQKSVFLYSGDSKRLQYLLGELTEIINEDEDDLRIYPVQHPARMWMNAGMTTSNAAVPLQRLDKNKSQSKSLLEWWRRWRDPQVEEAA